MTYFQTVKTRVLLECKFNTCMLYMYTIKKKDEVQVSLHSFSTTCEILVSLIGSACVIRL
ncbi:hypothetical protein CY35_05G019600 [Sphagnum magellanicum]|nr:hypothetical protein CY35_05G019600 [Sphagnum magellanicum]